MKFDSAGTFEGKPIIFHHAYLISGEREKVISDVLAFIETVRISELRRNPDLHIDKFDTFTVDNARKVSSLARLKSFLGRKIFIVCFNSATEEAQNSLLKIVEDPSDGVHFFFVVPSAENLLPTFRSRVFEINNQIIDKTHEKLAKEYISSDSAKRLELVKEMVSNIEDGGSKLQVVLFVNALEKELLVHSRQGKFEQSKESFESIAMAKNYLRDHGASVKLLLEHIALVIPVFNR